MTQLQNLLNRIDVWTPIFSMSEPRKVNAIDQSLRELRRKYQPAWTLKKTTLRVQKGVLLYPVNSNHGRLAFLSSSKDGDFVDQPRFVFTSYKDFVEDSSYRNDLAEVWENGARMLAVRNITDTNMTSVKLTEAETASEYAGSDDAGTPALDNVLFKTGNGSIRVPVTNSAGVATIVHTLASSATDTNYKRKYYQIWVYLPSAPTSIELRLRVDASNYLSKTVTTQHAGQEFVAGDWNLLSMDLNTATETGDVSSGVFASEVVILNGAVTGNYHLDSSYLRGWTLLDYRFYSKNNVQNSSGVEKELFTTDEASYDPTDLLIGPDIWSDVVLHKAARFLLADQKEESIKNEVAGYFEEAEQELYNQYPDLTPRQTTETYRFQDDYRKEMFDYDNIY